MNDSFEVDRYDEIHINIVTLKYLE